MKKPPKKFKKQKIEEKKKVQQFPSIYRFITEYGRFRLVWPTYRFLVFFFTVLFALSIVVAGYSLYITIQEKKATDTKRARVSQEIQYWEKIVSKYTGYRDAYLKLAVLQYQVGEFDRARYFARKGFEIDPNSREVGEMLRLLQ